MEGTFVISSCCLGSFVSYFLLLWWRKVAGDSSTESVTKLSGRRYIDQTPKEYAREEPNNAIFLVYSCSKRNGLGQRS